MHQGNTAKNTTYTFVSRETRRRGIAGIRPFYRLSPLAYTLSLLLLSGTAQAAGARPFSGDWFAAKGATRASVTAAASAGTPAGMPPPLAQQQQANARLQRSIASLGKTAAAIAAAQAMQDAARQAALNVPGSVPDGLTAGGLQTDTDPATRGWLNADAPVQSTSGGRTTVSITQTRDKAILNWETFNVGKNTEVDFHQQSDWAVLNRVNDPNARPGQIEGQIKGDGTVLLINRNGIVFSGASQVNVRNLVAAAANMTDSQFTTGGLYGTSANTATFTDALGAIAVAQGAQLTTAEPGSVTDGGGYVLLMGGEVSNAGKIATRKGQTLLAAGDSFIIRKGVGTDTSNLASTTRGNEVTLKIASDSAAGKVINTGLVIAREGDITLTGRDVRQDGTIISTTTVNQRGTVHLLTSTSDAGSSVALGKDATTAILIEDTSELAKSLGVTGEEAGATALDSQRDALIAENTIGGVLADRRDLSRIEITSGGDVTFLGNSLTLATGGQIAVKAQGRSFVADQASLDVSGAVGVQVAMASNAIKVNVQGNELRDSPGNRDSGKLINKNVWVDTRGLIYVPAGTGGYDGERWYTADGLLEVSGYLANRGHTIGEWAAQGGTVTLAGNEVITQAGSSVNISGGTIDVQSGNINTTRLKSTDGRIYAPGSGPVNGIYSGLYTGYSLDHARWRLTEDFYSPLLAPAQRLENGYTVGRDAGTLRISAPTAVVEGDVVANVFNNGQQVVARTDGVVDGYKLSHNSVAMPGTLALGNYLIGGTGVFQTDVKVGNIAGVTKGLAAQDALAEDRAGTAWFDAAWLNSLGLGALRLETSGAIAIASRLEMGDGGTVDLVAPAIDIFANIVARGGSVSATNYFAGHPGQSSAYLLLDGAGRAHVALHEGAKLDLRGIWTNAYLDASRSSGATHRNGGSVRFVSTHDVVFAAGSAIDVSSGGAILADGSFQGGKGGNVSLLADQPGASGAREGGRLVSDGDIRAYGVKGGGALILESAGDVEIGSEGQTYPASGASEKPVEIDTTWFNRGFSDYQIFAHDNLVVAEGTNIDVVTPVYRLLDGAASVVNGSDPLSAFELWTPPRYLEDPARGVLTQRDGASLLLQGGYALNIILQHSDATVRIGQGAVITVDPGQSINVLANGNLTVDGTLNAWGGTILIGQLDRVDSSILSPDYAIVIGETAVLDAAARAATAVDVLGHHYGRVADGGNIVIGGQIDASTGLASAADQFVVVRKGAVIDASGTQAELEIAGQGEKTVASNGGSISLASNNGLVLEGTFRAEAGGAGAAGGSLALALETPAYQKSYPNASLPDDNLFIPREFVLSQHPTGEGEQEPRHGLAHFNVDAFDAGGFDNLSLLSNGVLSFDGDVALQSRRSLEIYAGALGLTDAADSNSSVSLAAPYVRIAGPNRTRGRGGSDTIIPTVAGGTTSRSSEASLRVDADLIDLRDEFNLSGAHGTVTQPSGTAIELDRRGFSSATLESRGDIRLLAAESSDNGTQMISNSDIVLIAAQIYPATHAGARILTGTDSTIRIARVGSGLPATPQSAFGLLILYAGKIEQGGVLRAPLGTISLGVNANDPNIKSAAIHFLDGSITSVSGAGLTMPYGGTVDGLIYSYAGNKVLLTGAGGVIASGNTAGIFIQGQEIAADEGALLDLSGGGELTGAGFVSGRGGSIDVLRTALVNANPAFGYSQSGNVVYAIVPGYTASYAPVSPDAGAGNPAVGQQITIPDGVPGLPAGTYTLLPSTYALMKGAFRVEIGAGNQTQLSGASPIGNGSYVAAGSLGSAFGGVHDALPSQVILTPASVVRTQSAYNEMSYTGFALADAIAKGVPRAMIEADGKLLNFTLLGLGNPGTALHFDGKADFSGAGEDGEGGSANIDLDSGSSLEILASGQPVTDGFTGVSVFASDLNALQAPSLRIGARLQSIYGQDGQIRNFVSSSSVANIYLRNGATLRAAEVMFITGLLNGGIFVEQGASINTLGMGEAPYAKSGYIFGSSRSSILAVSNGQLDFLPPLAATPGEQDFGPGVIRIGVCPNGSCAGETRIYSEGSIAAVTDNDFTLSDVTRFGTRNLTLGVGAINAGDVSTLAGLKARNALPDGFTLNQQVLDRLLLGDDSEGVPALGSLILTARDSVNFYGTVTLDTIDPATGVSSLESLVLGTPAIYGYGEAADRAVIRTGTLIWNGTTTTPGTVLAGGAGTGSGSLAVEAERIEFGYSPKDRPNNIDDTGRMTLGFADVHLTASERITANHKGSLAVYQRQGEFVSGEGYAYSGGNLTLTTPLLTGAEGSINKITAGGTISVVTPEGQAATAVGPSTDGIGAELALVAGEDLLLNSTVLLPSGKLDLRAGGDLMLADGSAIDLSGRTLTLNDVAQYSWGGDLTLVSEHGNIRQAVGSEIDLSAKNNRGGLLTAIALDERAGVVDLQGTLLGGASGKYDAGGTWVPYLAGGIEIHAQSLGSGSPGDAFAALNRRLNQGEVFGLRSFQLRQGDLVIGSDVKANEVAVSVDGGHLTVDGIIDASGEQVGSIRLSGKEGLTLTGNAVLDAHGTVLRVDSYGQIIDSPNRAIVELNSGEGLLTLASGTRIDLRHGTDATIGSLPGQYDGMARGTLAVNAPRLGGATSGDIAIDASGALTIEGARSIFVNAVQRYDDAPYGTDISASGRPYQVIDQAYLDAKHAESTAFINAALGNAALMNGKLAGLNNASYHDAFHLRPGVEIVSATPDGDMIVAGDLDLSGYRYASVNPHTLLTGVYGSGEAGSLVVRAGGAFDIYGSINDGFAPPDPSTGEGREDGNGWLLMSGAQPFGDDVVMPRPVDLAEGTTYPQGSVLNFDLPFQSTVIEAQTLLPGVTRVEAELILPAGTVITAPIRDAGGNLLFAAGVRLAGAVTLPVGTQLDPGTRFQVDATVSGIWPRNNALPVWSASGMTLVQRGAVTLPMGARLPAGAHVKLPDGTGFIELRPTGANGQQGLNWAVATMLPEGTHSWSIRLVAGADTGAADTRTIRPLAVDDNLQLADTHFIAKRDESGTPRAVWSTEGAGVFGTVAGDPVPADWLLFCEITPSWCETQTGATATAKRQVPSVIRTGTGDLDLLSAGDFRMQSLYGVYTAGAPSSSLAAQGSADPWQQARGKQTDGTVLGSNGAAYEYLTESPNYQAWYPEHGGNVLLSAGGDFQGDILKTLSDGVPELASAAVGNWLWRQGSGDTGNPATTIPTAWWINFGSYALQPNSSFTNPILTGFTGIGTLGGGNLTVAVAGDAGLLAAQGDTGSGRSQGLVLAVGSTGRVTDDGTLVQTGGGDLHLRVGGQVNPSAPDMSVSTVDLNGVVTNLRGALQVQAGAIGALELSYQLPFYDSRGSDPYVAGAAEPKGGLTLMAGDSGVNLETRGDLVLDGVGDPGRVVMWNSTGFTGSNGTYCGGGGLSQFSLWTDRTALDLLSLAGNLMPLTQGYGAGSSSSLIVGAEPGRYYYPSILRATAGTGNIYFPGGLSSLITAPSAGGELQLIAGDSIYASGQTITRSGGDPALLSGPFRPAFEGYFWNQSYPNYSNFSPAITSVYSYPLFAFGSASFSEQPYDLATRQPIRFYAVDGDIVGLKSGSILSWSDGETRYEGSGPLWMIAGRDIVNSGTPLSTSEGPTFDSIPQGAVRGGNFIGEATGNLIIHSDPLSVSIVSAGRDIRLSTFNIAGPGQLEVSAGRDIYQAGLSFSSGPGKQYYQEGAFISLGSTLPGFSTDKGGASIALMAGMANGVDWQAMRDLYLNPVNQADVTSGLPLADQPGKVAHTYEKELAAWLSERFGVTGSAEEMMAYFDTLPQEQQRIFLRGIYYAELRDSGREYNDVESPRFGSYLRGRQMIAALFPVKDANGNVIERSGDIIMYGGAGVRTNFGGNIEMLAPGGQIVVGVQGQVPPASAGVMTQGQGDIRLFSQGSLLLGLSRIMTTFGGDIFAWSEEGDINAGRGSKTTVLYTPPRLTYDQWGNVTLAPQAPSSGAGIGTLQPIAEVKPGDVDLIAPLGTIDAGEAGIRVSGNVNIAALRVVNADNIQVQGKSSGLPTVAAVNVGALTAASQAASSAVQAAEQISRQAQRNQPSVINVQILGYGSERLESGGAGITPAAATSVQEYDKHSPLKVLGLGKLDPTQLDQLTSQEKGNLM